MTNSKLAQTQHAVLRWTTNTKNKIDKKSRGTLPFPFKIYFVLCVQQVLQNCALKDEYFMLESLETKYGESKITEFIEFTVLILLYFPLKRNSRCKYRMVFIRYKVLR